MESEDSRIFTWIDHDQLKNQLMTVRDLAIEYLNQARDAYDVTKYRLTAKKIDEMNDKIRYENKNLLVIYERFAYHGRGSAKTCFRYKIYSLIFFHVQSIREPDFYFRASAE